MLAKLSVPPPAAGVSPCPYHWTVDSFSRALDAAAFGLWPRVELVRGVIIEHDGQTPRHAFTGGHIAGILRAALEPRLMVREVSPIHISVDTEPDTDVLVVTGGINDYRERHPGPADVVILVEIADSSTEYDLGEKALLYAEAGIADYWVVLPDENAVIVHRNPTAEGYGSVTTLGVGDTISPLAVPEAVLPMRELLAL